MQHPKYIVGFDCQAKTPGCRKHGSGNRSPRYHDPMCQPLSHSPALLGPSVGRPPPGGRQCLSISVGLRPLSAWPTWPALLFLDEEGHVAPRGRTRTYIRRQNNTHKHIRRWRTTGIMVYDPVVASVTLTGSVMSFVASTCVLLSFIVYNKEQRSFRHALVLNLTLAEFINSLDNSVSGIIYMRDRDLSPGVPCVINGLVGQISVQAVDFSILAIAVVTLLTVTHTTFMPDVSRVTKILVCLSVWVIPMTTGVVATAMGAMKPVGTNWCWITAARPDLRYALTHGWRFAVIFGTIAIYLYIWFYLRNHFRSMGIALKTGWSQLSAEGQQFNSKPGAGGGMGRFQGMDGFGKEKDGAAFAAGTLEQRQGKQSMAQGQADAPAHLTIPRAAARRDSMAMYGATFYDDNLSSVGEVEEDREGLLTPIEREMLVDEEWARNPKLKLQTKGGKRPVVSWSLPRIPNTPLVSHPNTPLSPSSNNTIKIGFAITSDSPQPSPPAVRGLPGGDATDALTVPGGRLERPERAHKRSASDASGLDDFARGTQNHKRSTSDSSMAVDDSRASIGSYSLFPNAKTSAARRSGPADDIASSTAQQQQQQQDGQTNKDDGSEWPPVMTRKSRGPPPPRRPTNISEFPMRQEKRNVDREVQRMLLLNAYPILYVILWIPGIVNRLMEAAGHPVTGRAAQALQSSSQFIGLANALTYGFNRHIRHRITGDLLAKLRPGKVTEIVSR
ncbi:hypothetical protein MAPG_06234 [Magnaporthiopsis poae ATCC 64411]|uniref:Glucose receptor Git3-like N-terminal domain-containing protein n=1 Tax=Magnaporthiopsis poae (strain ATCC 64411 / 73-15) TaxID=644358 RepID=A0A0C4E1H4_MAGP6|nr:hypothetical protein MAPG_06234 [Magnaporthiopsis poae ATCC 64411]